MIAPSTETFFFPNTVQSGESNGVGVADRGERTQHRQMRGPGWPSAINMQTNATCLITRKY
ncbi:hypothetical protein V1478_008143 [Vespula squamosa]|uniref:Uncharacterized protein n=1 Tax=Vespula squamosa TaxID=30214 RepID=A0ABD2AZS9_VESSQ